MIPKEEKFSDMKPITGSIDKVIEHSQKVNVDYVYSDEHAIIEVMEEYSVTRDAAIELIEQARKQIISNSLEELLKEGKIEIVGYENGEPLYSCVDKKPKKKNKKKK